ncbi:TetR/AcrR family transcriptional regulator [Amycolatopsis dongchuanensis]|uniref:TetR/AcrR family transcriptional regulator n=1 Tax=Amycolatopsis TaxID=1813 RepID=UPI0031F89C79
MANRAAARGRRQDGLSREVIIRAATDLLDSGGESALTLRALTTRLKTGYGAVYHHVADKDDLLAAATDEVVARVLAGVAVDAEPRQALRGLALGLFDEIDAHPWVGAQLARHPLESATLEIYECVGRLLDALAVPGRALFDAAGALMNYVLGVAGQNAAQARSAEGADRAAFLAAVAGRWARLDPGRYPFVRKAAARLPEHDDREQFLAGIDIFLAGIATLG